MVSRYAWFPALLLAGCVRMHHRPEPVTGRVLDGGADVHVHLTMDESLFVFQGQADGPIVATSPNQNLVNQLPREGLRGAGVQLVVATLWPAFDLHPERTALDEALRSMAALRRFVDRHPGYGIARNADDARRLIQRDLIAILPHLEGAEAIQSVEDVDALFAAGYRSIGLVHFTDNAIADAHEGQFGPMLSWLLDGEDGALTPLGEAAVRRMFDLGILVDLSHSSGRTREAVLRIAEELRVPLLYSHAGADWDVPYTLDDDHARRISSLGGLIGVGIYRHDLLLPLPEAERLKPHALKTCDDVVAIWKHYVTLVGGAQVVLGSDLNSAIVRAEPGGRCPNGLRHAGDLPVLFAAIEQEVPDAMLDGSAERVLDLFTRVELKARAHPPARSPPSR